MTRLAKPHCSCGTMLGIVRNDGNDSTTYVDPDGIVRIVVACPHCDVVCPLPSGQCSRCARLRHEPTS
jgi:hypothetical protein